MKYYIQYYKYSTGYIQNSRPPQFCDSHIKLIEACGSDGVATLDGRLSLHGMHEMAEKFNESNFKRFPAYKIMRSCNGLYTKSSPVGSLQHTKYAK